MSHAIITHDKSYKKKYSPPLFDTIKKNMRASHIYSLRIKTLLKIQWFRSG